METFDQSFNSWMHPAGVVNIAEVVNARKVVALGLRDTGVDAYTLVLAAFGKVDDEVRVTVEQRLQDNDPTHTPGKKYLVELLCASAVMSAMERADKQAVDLAMLVSSALFRGMKPRIKSMAESAAYVMAAAAARSRARLAPKKIGPRVQAASSPEAFDAAAAVSALTTRIEGAIRHFDSQLQLLNEEVDVLWWARSGRSASGSLWVERTELERAIWATAEVSELVIEFPVTGATFEVLRGIVNGPKGKSENFAEICKVASVATQIPSVENSRWLLPILSGIRIARTYPADARAGIITTELGLDAEVKFKIIDIPEQLLRELAILKRVM